MSLKIFLDNPTRSYFAGQTLTGHVVVNARESKEIKCITLKFQGKANVHWKERRTVSSGSGQNRSTRTVTDHYRAEETYLNTKFYLLGNENTKITLPAGQSTYPLQCTLPVQLPSSYCSQIGQVSYFVEVKIRKAWYKFDDSEEVHFSVNGILDLNVAPTLANPSCFEKQKDICCLWCKEGPVALKVNVGKTGFVPGENAQFVAEISNHSKTEINKLAVKFVQVVTYYARGKQKQNSHELQKISSPSAVKPGDDEVWNAGFQIHPLPPTDLAGCRIINVRYFLKFTLNIASAMTKDLRLDVPITIGTIPFRNTFTNFMRPPAAFPEPMPSAPFAFDSAAESLPNPSAPIFDMYPDLPPPSYGEAMQKERFEGHPEKEDDEGEGGNATPPPSYSDFVPKYATYGWIQPN